jgi:RimJ/RimL family protein N-acetyltransferase
VRPDLTALETRRLRLRRLCEDDHAFLIDLLNQPSFVRFIGDRGVRTAEQAKRYVRDGPAASYERHGFGLLCVELKRGGTPIGICGLLRRDVLEDPDVGFAFLPDHWGRGYAREAAQAVLDAARERLGLERVAAITSLDNAASIRLLEALGFGERGRVTLAAGEPELRLFVRELDARAG